MEVRQRVGSGIANQTSAEAFCLSCSLCVMLSPAASFSIQFTWTKVHFQALFRFTKQAILRVSCKSQAATIQSLTQEGNFKRREFKSFLAKFSVVISNKYFL